MLLPTRSQDTDEQFKLAHTVADRKICVTLLQYSVNKPKISYAQVRFFAQKKEDEKFQQTVYVNLELEEFIYLSPSFSCLIKSKCNYLLLIISLCFRVKMSWNIGNDKTFFLHPKSKLGLYLVALTTPKTPPENLH